MIAVRYTALQTEKLRRECLLSSMRFTQVIFKGFHRKDFVVNHHHKLIADVMDRVYRGELTRVVINMPPRFTKTEMVVKMGIAKGLAHNPASKYIHISYSQDLALDNSEWARDYVKSRAYQTMFPNVKIKSGSDAKNKWYTENNGGVYAAAAGGALTGFGAGAIDDDDQTDDELNQWLEDLEIQTIKNKEVTGWQDPYRDFGGAIFMDDPHKPDEAENELARTKVVNRYINTIRSRVNSRRTPIVITMQRVHPEDMTGYLLDNEGNEWYHLCLPAINADGTALWPHKMNLVDLAKEEKADKIVFQRQYMQNAAPREGMLYEEFETYEVLPLGIGETEALTDPADTGKDYTASVFYREFDNRAYITRMVYTQVRAETTEVLIANTCVATNCKEMIVESNNGGRGFGRAVRKLLQAMHWFKTKFFYYSQHKNKEARILSNASAVNQYFVFPAGWDKKYPAAYKAITNYTAQGKNDHDDLPDCLTAIYEHKQIRAKKGMRKQN